MKTIIEQLVTELNFKKFQIQQVLQLTQEGNTVPFIARYRKEMTGSLDEVQIRDILERSAYLENMANRKEEVLRIIAEQGKMTPELEGQIKRASKLQEIEDLYRPYKQKRRTKATAAKEKGLEPLADWLLTAGRGDIQAKASEFVSEEKEVHSAADALAGAKDIIAEHISDDAGLRKWIRNETFRNGRLESSVKYQEKDEKNVYEMYYSYEEAVNKAAPHRILALNRGEKEDILRVSVRAESGSILKHIESKIIKAPGSPVEPYLKEAVEDAYKRLIQPSIEREIRKELTEKAEDRAIHIFSENLRNLLLQPPLKGKTVLGVDPAFRTGCKLAVINETGKVLEIGVIYPHPPVNKKEEARSRLKKILAENAVGLIAIGNGTASRETEQFVADTLKELQQDISYIIVNEAGASVYSASEAAREEFPGYQVEERSAVSIARRLQDPLAELVKIDPKSVGVGQYQHDVSQKKLADSLTFVVETAVNSVGVNVNTASAAILQYVSGLSKTVALNIVKKRDEEGKFVSRSDLKNIPRLGSKTYEQAIGFLRIPDGTQPLDATGIHPENYAAVTKLLKSMGFTSKDLGTSELRANLDVLEIPRTAQELEMGEITLKDIIDSLKRPGRDPRDELPKPLLKQGVLKLADLHEGMELQGTIRNVVDFGAFVDIGVKQDGLVHISKLSKGFVKHPLDIVSVGDVVTVWVDGVDTKKQRVALSMVGPHA
nr:Tex family protein [Peribacillus kribbensis]